MGKLFLAIAIAFSICVAAQDGKQPSNSQVQAQMKQAASDAKKQRDDIKKQIAESKANNEDPATIKQLEDQLVTLDKMVTMLEGTNLTNRMKTDEAPVTKIIEPKFISPIKVITLKAAVKTPTEKEATDYLLWYQGKKINNNTLITVDGTIVQYNRSQNIVIVDPDEKKDSTPYISLAHLLSQTGRMKIEFVSMMDGITNNFLMAPEIVNAYYECDYMQHRYYSVAKNYVTVFIPEHRLLEGMWQEMARRLNALPPIEIRMPPERKNLCTCGTEASNVYQDAVEQWQETFWEEEDELLETYMRIFAYFEYHPDSRSQLRTAPGLSSQLDEAFNTVIERKATKLKKLADIYDNGNIYVEDALVYAAMTFNKELVEKIVHHDNSECIRLRRMSYSLIDQVTSMVVKKKIFEKYIDEQKRLRNYNVVFDYAIAVNHEVNKEILNGVHGSFYKIPLNYKETWMEGLKKFNRFKLKLGLDFELHDGKEDDLAMTADGKLESDEMIVSIGRTNSCKWHLYLTQVNYRNKPADDDKYYIPFTVKNGSKFYPKVPRGPFHYEGPITLKMAFPEFRFSFCNNTVSDSAVMQILRYSDFDLKAFPKPDYANSYSTDMLAYANKMFIGMMKTKENADDLTGLVDKMLNVDKVQIPLAPTGNALLDRMVRDFFIEQHRLDLQTQLPDVSHTENTVALFDAVNQSPTLVSQTHKTVDPADADKSIQIRLVRGDITITLVHAPL